MASTSYATSVEDNGSPGAALDIAGQAVRDFNHRAFGRFGTAGGWSYAPDAYRALGELTVLAGGLPQCFDQIAAALRDHLGRGYVGIDPGTTWAGDPAGAIEEAAAQLSAAAEAARQMYAGIAAAQVAINAAHYTGPELDNGSA